MERGLLDLSVQLSTRNITAGNEFALFVLAKNPFDKPVWIREVNVSLPSDLRLAHDREALERIQEAEDKERTAAQERRRSQEDLGARLDGLAQEVRNLGTKNARPEELASETHSLLFAIEDSIDRLRAQLGGQAQVHVRNADIGTIKLNSTFSQVHLGGNEPSEAVKVGKIELQDSGTEVRSAAARTVRLKSSLPDAVALQPGSTVVYTAVLNVEKSLIFTPSQYRLQFNVNYAFCPDDPRNFTEATQFADEVLTNTIAHELAIRPSVYSIIIGATLGGLIGSSANLLQGLAPTGALSFDGAALIRTIVTIVVAVILSGMAIVFMARKSDTQSFVSIEDFWGGMLIGFLVGYTGTSFFQSLTGIAAGNH